MNAKEIHDALSNSSHIRDIEIEFNKDKGAYSFNNIFVLQTALTYLEEIKVFSTEISFIKKKLSSYEGSNKIFIEKVEGYKLK